MPGEALRAKIEANLATTCNRRNSAPSIWCAGLADFTPAMPRFVTAFIEAQIGS